MEILEDLKHIDEVYLPVGGGGLIAGIALVFKSLKPDVKIIGVKSTSFLTMKKSLQENKITKLQIGYSIADGIAIKTPGELTFGLVKKYVDDIVLVDDLSTVKAMFLLMERSKIVVEPAGAASLAYLISEENGKTRKRNKNIVSIVSGGNVDMYLLG